MPISKRKLATDIRRTPTANTLVYIQGQVRRCEMPNVEDCEMPNVEDLSNQQLRNWIRDVPEPYASQARAELIRRGEAL